MTVRIKIIVDPPASKEIKFGYRHQTFFIKLPDRLYEELTRVVNVRPGRPTPCGVGLSLGMEPCPAEQPLSHHYSM